MDNELPALDELIPLSRAAALCGLSVFTLKVQAQRGKLQTVRPGRERLTTRRWLRCYLNKRDTRRGSRRDDVVAV
jgi:hypothetical protein